MGARALKNSVYVLPNNDDALEDFEWLAREIRGEGGDAMICEASFVGSDMTDGDVGALFEAQVHGAPAPRDERARSWQNLTWVTREGVKVDRIGSAWLIRRFVDKDAAFKFVPARGYQPSTGEVRFDMYEGEFTHDGDACTFETMTQWFGLAHGALQQLSEIVHDVDCKDAKFGRPEAAGLAAMIAGLVRAHPSDDAARIGGGMPLFDALYASLGGRIA